MPVMKFPLGLLGHIATETVGFFILYRLNLWVFDSTWLDLWQKLRQKKSSRMKSPRILR